MCALVERFHAAGVVSGDHHSLDSVDAGYSLNLDAWARLTLLRLEGLPGSQEVQSMDVNYARFVCEVQRVHERVAGVASVTCT